MIADLECILGRQERTEPPGHGCEDFDMAEFGEPDWFAYPMLRRADMLAALEDGHQLDGRAINLFRNALTREPYSDLVRHYIGPNLYQPGSHYIYTTPDTDRFGYKNWRPTMTAKAIELRSIVFCGLFSNTLSWIAPTAPKRPSGPLDEAHPGGALDLDGGTERCPSERTFNAGFAVYTIEFDHMPLDEQLQIIYSGRIKRIDHEFHRCRDYRGYEVVYSGGKSLHFHFCFDLRHLKHDLAVEGNTSYRDNWTRDLPDCLLRPAYSTTWHRLSAIFCEIAETELLPDPELQRWEQLRRFPWALRLVTGTHPLGMPAGHLIRQPVLASGIFQNAKRGATEWFHDPLALSEACRPEQVRRRRRTFIEPDFVVSSSELQLFEEQAGAAFRQIVGAEYPKFDHYEATNTGFKCYFFNGPNDRNPSSFCEGNRSRSCCKAGTASVLTGCRSARHLIIFSIGWSPGTQPTTALRQVERMTGSLGAIRPLSTTVARWRLFSTSISSI